MSPRTSPETTDPKRAAQHHNKPPIRGGGRRPARVPTCHPERKHVGFGLCRACYNKLDYATAPRRPPATKEDRRRYKLKEKYGLSVAQFEEMVRQQSGCCAICACPPKDGQRLAVDHSHTTSRVRALLCALCNGGLALFRENSASLARAIEYLARHASHES